MSMIKADATAENKPAYSPRINIRSTERSRRTREDAHKDQRGIQVFIVFLDEATVMIVSHPLELIVEFDAGVAGSPKGIWKNTWQRFTHSILQARNNRKNVIRKVRGGGREVDLAHALGSIVVSPIAGYQELQFVVDEIWGARRVKGKRRGGGARAVFGV